MNNSLIFRMIWAGLSTHNLDEVNFMRKCACLMMTLLFFLTPVFLTPMTALAQETTVVAVMPVQMVADGAQLEQLNRLTKGLLSVIVTGLADQGMMAMTMGDNTLALDEDSAQAQAREMGANYIFSARVVKKGENFDITGQLQALTPSGKSSKRLTVTAESSSQLPQAVGQLLELVTDHFYDGGALVESVNIVGNTMIDSQAVLNTLRIQPGGSYNETKATSDIKRIYALGFFDDVRVEVMDGARGKKIRYLVQERNKLGRIIFRGHKKFDEEDLKEVINIKVNDFPSERNIADSVANLKSLYMDKGFSNAKIMTSLETNEQGLRVLVYNISEGGKIYIKEINFDGNAHFSDWALSREIETSSRNFFLSWLSGSGKLNQEKLSGDSQKLSELYHNSGFLQAQVGDPQIENTDDGGLIITFPIVEGQRFRVGKVTIGGAVLSTDNVESMKSYLAVADETWFSREVMQEDVKALQNYYSDQGYAHNSVEPRITEPQEGEGDTLDLEFVVQPKNKVYFDRITIVGNNKTRDKVIRRQLAVVEGDLFSSSRIQASQDNLMRSSYFEQANLSPGPSDTDDKMNLRVEVKERSTGSFQIGGGYSNYNSIFGVIRLTQDNLFGYGRRVAVEANVGSQDQQFTVSFTDPWVFDIPLTLGIDVFRTESDYDNYTKGSTGVALRAGYPVWANFYLTGQLSVEKIDITDVTEHFKDQNLEEYGGDTILSTTLRRDTRNHFFFPSRGSITRLNYSKAVEVLGGDTDFSRYELEAAYWYPLPFFKGASIMAHGEIGYMTEDSKDGLPTYEKFMMGGINSVRGYDYYSISPKNKYGESIGGEKMLVLNAELGFPILAEEGVYAVLFYDAGQVWSKNDSYDLGELRSSYGGGLRYLSPMGPIRIEYGKPLDREKGDSNGQWEFSMGSMF